MLWPQLCYITYSPPLFFTPSVLWFLYTCGNEFSRYFLCSNIVLCTLFVLPHVILSSPVRYIPIIIPIYLQRKYGLERSCNLPLTLWLQGILLYTLLLLHFSQSFQHLKWALNVIQQPYFFFFLDCLFFLSPRQCPASTTFLLSNF